MNDHDLELEKLAKAVTDAKAVLETDAIGNSEIQIRIHRQKIELSNEQIKQHQEAIYLAESNHENALSDLKFFFERNHAGTPAPETADEVAAAVEAIADEPPVETELDEEADEEGATSFLADGYKSDNFDLSDLNNEDAVSDYAQQQRDIDETAGVDVAAEGHDCTIETVIEVMADAETETDETEAASQIDDVEDLDDDPDAEMFEETRHSADEYEDEDEDYGFGNPEHESDELTPQTIDKSIGDGTARAAELAGHIAEGGAKPMRDVMVEEAEAAISRVTSAEAGTIEARLERDKLAKEAESAKRVPLRKRINPWA